MTDDERNIERIIEIEYPEKIDYIIAAMKACIIDKTPVGLRFERIMALYNHFYGKDHIDAILITNEIEIIALLIDHINIDKKYLKEHSPPIYQLYRIFKHSKNNVNTKILYEFVQPELDVYLKRLSLL